jgi:D-3-phosphoglycerate dehydrogenase
MIGLVGSLLGRAGVNISDMDVGRSSSGVAALMVLSTDEALSPDVVAELRAADGILQVATVDQD